MWLVVACATYPCLFVSCEQQRFVIHSLSNMCLCLRRSSPTVDDYECFIDVIPLHRQQPQRRRRRREVTCVDCSRRRMTCDCVDGRRRRRRAAACLASLCGHHVRRAATSCRNGGTPSGPSELCQCREGFFGDRCQLLNPCSQQPCRNGGYCRSLVDLTGAMKSRDRK